MGIVNRRNAVVGWAVIKVGKRLVRPKSSDTLSGPKAGGIAAGSLAALGGLLAWRRARRDGSDADT